MINAFMVCGLLPDVLLEKAKSHLKKLSVRYKKDYKELTFGAFDICLVGSDVESSIEVNGSVVIVIRHAEQLRWDRFLVMTILSEKLIVENDYAGTIPCYYSSRNGLIASNVEPCVYLGSNTSLEDISAENIYGYIKYGHYIWDETAWKHIFQMLPDSQYEFDAKGKLKSSKYLATVKASDESVNLSDKDVAAQLKELNSYLVTRSLIGASDIILPLSSGYDSRMIYAVAAISPFLFKKLRCFTYGSRGSIEVEAGRRLSQLHGIEWYHVELPCKFLHQSYLEEIADVFGASLHMHGMYQLEFYQIIRDTYGVPEGSVLTSGFMTGVPAGQHNGLLSIENTDSSLVLAMSRFSQSKVWVDDELKRLPIFNDQEFMEVAEARFKSAFNRFDGEIFQKAVMFDVWTRQRNFISYYPRTLEWLTSVKSPHMNAEYANFFMSLSRKHLWNRKAVELMFINYYPNVSRIGSNSNGLTAVGSQYETAMFFVARVLNRLRLQSFVPEKYRNASFDFDLTAVNIAGKNSFYPFLHDEGLLSDYVDLIGGEKFIIDCYERSLGGDIKAYLQIVALQSIAFDTILC